MKLEKLWILIEDSYVDSLVTCLVKVHAPLSNAKHAAPWRLQDFCLDEITLRPRHSIFKLRLNSAWKRLFQIRFGQRHNLGNHLPRFLNGMLFPICGKIKQRREETLKIWNCHWVIPSLGPKDIPFLNRKAILLGFRSAGLQLLQEAIDPAVWFQHSYIIKELIQPFDSVLSATTAPMPCIGKMGLKCV